MRIHVAKTVTILTAALVCFLSPVEAGSLRVSPITLDLLAPTAAGTIKLESDQDKTLSVQLRLFRWVQKDGESELVPTNDVVVSPPMLKVRKGKTATVRVVRLSKKPVDGEETYRLIVDELPDPVARKNGVVSLVVRQSLPVFFRQPSVAPPKLAWRLEKRPDANFLIATNSGQRRIRISEMKISGSDGQSVTVAKGLFGYVLGGSTMRFKLPEQARPAVNGKHATISATGDTGAINVQAPIVHR